MGSFLLDILEFIILALFLKAMARGLGSLFRSPRIHVRTNVGGRTEPAPAAPQRGEMVRDPVCVMFVATELSEQLRQGTDTLHFCSRECLDKFKKDAQHVAS